MPHRFDDFVAITDSLGIGSQHVNGFLRFRLRVKQTDSADITVGSDGIDVKLFHPNLSELSAFAPLRENFLFRDRLVQTRFNKSWLSYSQPVYALS